MQEASKVKMSGSEKIKANRNKATKFLVSEYTYDNFSIKIKCGAKRHSSRTKQWQEMLKKKCAAHANVVFFFADYIY